jgi:predicted hotdog family 3-hydroxylacyl-ACP dehydratase
MVLVDRILATDYAGNGRVEARIHAGKPYIAPNGGFATHWLIEIMAQAVGCIFTLQDRNAGDLSPQKIGYLVAVDDSRFLPGARLAVGSILQVDVHLIHAFYPIGQYRATVREGGTEVAHAMMKFMTDDERSLPFDAF